MLKIRPDQMQAFSAVADELLAQRVMDHLRANYADTLVHLPDRRLMLSDIADRDLKTMVQTGLTQARSYGMTHESALAGFVAIMFEAAPNFYSYPLTKQILEEENTPANSRVKLLLDQVSEQDWEKIKAGYDPDVWKLPPRKPPKK